MDVTKAIQDIKAGKIEYELDKTNIIHVPVGKTTIYQKNIWTTSRRLLMQSTRQGHPL